MELSPEQRRFVEGTNSAAMITVNQDGVAKAVRVGIAVVDGRIWSSGLETRARTARLRRDPRATLFVFDSGFEFLTLETTVTILEGPEAPEMSVRLFRVMQHKPEGPLTWYGKELSEDEFLAAMVEEKRLVYEFEVQRAYGPLLK
jgi:hypothetical protein